MLLALLERYLIAILLASQEPQAKRHASGELWLEPDAYMLLQATMPHSNQMGDERDLVGHFTILCDAGGSVYREFALVQPTLNTLMAGGGNGAIKIEVARPDQL